MNFSLSFPRVLIEVNATVQEFKYVQILNEMRPKASNALKALESSSSRNSDHKAPDIDLQVQKSWLLPAADCLCWLVT